MRLWKVMPLPLRVFVHSLYAEEVRYARVFVPVLHGRRCCVHRGLSAALDAMRRWIWIWVFQVCGKRSLFLFWADVRKIPIG